MADREPATELPTVIPPEEEAATLPEGQNYDLAVREQAWLDRELSGYTVQAAALRNDLARAYIKNIDADRSMRTTYAGRILRYLEFYSGGVAILLVLDGFKPSGFDLDPGVVAALVGSTALAAIGLVGFIARGLFQAPPAPPPSEKG